MQFMNSKDKLWESHREGVYYCMEYLQGKHFSITDPKNTNTVIYEIVKNENGQANNAPKYTMERLDSIEELRNEGTKRTYFVDLPKKSGNQLLFLTFENETVTVNQGILKEDEIKFIRKPVPMVFNTIYKESGGEYYKEYNYTPNMKRQISIVDPDTGEEVKPILYYDSKTNEVKGKCKLQSNKTYLAFQLRQS